MLYDLYGSTSLLRAGYNVTGSSAADPIYMVCGKDKYEDSDVANHLHILYFISSVGTRLPKP